VARVHTVAHEETVPLPPPIGIVRATIYSAGNFGKNVLWGAADLTLLYLMTDIMKIDPAVAGWVILISMVANVIFDPIIGNMVDSTASPLGRSGPYIVVGAPLFAGSFACLYALPALGVSSLPITLVVLVVFRLSFSIMDAPHNALLGTIIQNGQARSVVSALRLFFSSASNLTVAVTLSGVVSMKGIDTAALIARNAALLSLVSVVVMFAGVFAVRRYDNPQPIWRLRLNQSVIPADVARARPVLKMMGLIVVLGSGAPLFPKMIVFHAVHVAHDPSRSGLMLIAMALGQIAGLACWTYVGRKLTSRELLLVIMICLSIVSLVVLVAGDGGRFVDCALAAGVGACVAGAFTAIWVIVAECADEFRTQTGRHATGAIFGLAIVAIKLGQGIAAAFAGSVLTWVDYAPDGANSSSASIAIGALRGGGPLLAALAVAFMCQRLSLSNDKAR
jgi:glycoside/pentoside/hexuronide:cation symporter, GPH family